MRIIVGMFAMLIGGMGLLLAVMGVKTKAPFFVCAFFMSQALMDFSLAYFIFKILM